MGDTSRFKPEDPAGWGLMADFVCHGAPPSQQRDWPRDLNAHREGNGQPAGANHLFNDGHASWIKWSHGLNMRTNTIWATGNLYIWRRTLELP